MIYISSATVVTIILIIIIMIIIIYSLVKLTFQYIKLGLLGYTLQVLGNIMTSQ